MIYGNSGKGWDETSNSSGDCRNVIFDARFLFLMAAIIQVNTLYIYKLGTHLGIKVLHCIYFYRKYKCKMEDKLHNPFDVLNERLKRIENLLSTVLSESHKQLSSPNNKPKGQKY